MVDNLLVSLAITVIGMGLVFGAIFVLWGVLALITRIAADKEEARPAALAEGDIETVAAPTAELELKERAALAAVTVALARSSDMEPHEFPLPGTPLVSAWQAVMRTKMLNKRGPVR